MRSDCPLPEYDQATGKDIGAFHRDAHRQGPVQITEVIAGPVDNSLASMNVPGIVHRLTHPFGGVQFHDGRYHRGFVAELTARTGTASGSHDEDGIARRATTYLMPPLKLTHESSKS